MIDQHKTHHEPVVEVVTAPDVYSAAEQHQLLRLHQELRNGEGIETFAQFAEETLSGKKTTVLSRMNGEIVGMVVLDETNPQEAWIRHNVVRADVGGRGIGTHMFRKILEQARDKGLQNLFLECNQEPSRESARKLYAKYKFVVVDPTWKKLERPDGSIYVEKFWVNPQRPDLLQTQ